jgi:hypothetical protein
VKKTLLFMMVLTGLVALTMVACKGKQGAAGPSGANGSNYTAPLCSSPSQKGVTALLNPGTFITRLYAQSVTLTSSAEGVSISMYVNQSPVTGQVRMGLYADDSDFPGNLVAEADPAFLTPNGWTTAALRNTYLPAGVYWMACHFSNSTQGMAVDGGGDWVMTTASFDWGVLPETFPSAGISKSSWRMSQYISVCP